MGVAVRFAAWGWVCCGPVLAQIAPGPLSRAHADLEGITSCGSCHDFGQHRLKCIECHVEIKRRVEAGTGLHARAYKSTPGATDCARCHAEHRGSKVALIPLDRKAFDHGMQTGFILEGKHREQKCESCHTAAKISAAARSDIKAKDANRSFLGLRRECKACHQEPHQNQLGDDCMKCHDFQAWKPASKFNHARAAFQLTGQHQQVQCQKCHTRAEGAGIPEAPGSKAPSQGSPQQKVLLFKGLSYSGCQSCHADQHHGAFQEVKLSGKCEGCHDTGGWKSNRPARDFDHNSTKFRLVGKHTELACGKCHKENNFSRPIPHELCRDCHEDPHKGQFASRATGSDCASCHSPAGFKPPLFDREAHMRSAFPLLGKHASLPCGKCHQPEGRDARLKIGKLQCPECHAEPHGGQFAPEPYGNKCNLCHSETGFETTTFTRERHAQTQFPLTGRHADVECRKCHKPLTAADSKTVPTVAAPLASPPAFPFVGADRALPDARRQFHFASRACDTCHKDPHGIDAQANLPCTTCHVTQQWRAPLPFDHSRTRFRLEGSHQDAANPIPCIKCHTASRKADAEVTGNAPIFSRASTQCSRCHAGKDAHGGQFTSAGERQEDCASCHTPTVWNAGSFDHDKARFVLNLAHRKVPCAKCHKEQREVNGKLVRLYRDTPAECLKCH